MTNHHLMNGVIATLMLRIAGRIEYNRLLNASRYPGRASARTLRNILEFAKDSEYGKEHHFDEILAARSRKELYSRWQKYVKTNDYEDFRPYVDKMKNGAENMLFPGKPVMYATTSGTTAEPKLIPVTKTYLENVYNKITRAWLYNFIKLRPKVFHGAVLTIVGKMVEGYTPDGTPVGAVSGFTRRRVPKPIRNLYAIPSCVYEIKDYTARYYTIMRLSLVKDVYLLVTANPSTLIEMQNCINEWFDEIVGDIEKGGLSDKVNVSDEIRKELQPLLGANPKRAAQLRELKNEHGTVYPKHYWPNLQILNTWKCGNTKVFLDKIENAFPKTTLHLEIGYFSSECRFGFANDETGATVLFPHMHYYEFVAEEDLDAANEGKPVRYWQVNELKEGKRYCPYITTFAGLYRYNMSDLIEVGTNFQRTPRVFMVQKINGIVSITGEKLHERQFFDAVQLASAGLHRPVRFCIGFAVPEEARYHFYYEFEDQGTTQEEAEAFTRRVDELLSDENIEYESKRESFRVKDPVTHRLVRNSFDKFKKEWTEAGARDGQFKLNLLLQDEKRHAGFKKLVID